jgi:hypothetical protein
VAGRREASKMSKMSQVGLEKRQKKEDLGSMP